MKALVESGSVSPSHAAPSRPSALPTEETRRQVSVLFADIVESTALSGQLDPEDLRELIGQYQMVASAAVERYGGRLHHTLGDGLMASWGYPRAREDDAVRAVLAGLALLESVNKVAVRLYGVPRLRVRVGVHTGLAVIADTTVSGRREFGNLIGETPNLAARLQSVAAPGTLIISDTTENLVRGSFEILDLGFRTLRGVSRPIRIFTVIGQAKEGDRPGHAYTNAHPRIVGRDREMRVLTAAWQAVVAGHGRVVFLYGEPGLGKTRLALHVWELVEADNKQPIMVRCAALENSRAFYPVRRMLERLAGIQHGDPPALRRARFVAFCAAEPLLARPHAVNLLAALIGVPSDDDMSAIELTPEQRRTQTIDLLIEYLTRVAAAHPTLLLVEDLHWADPSTVEFLSQLLREGSPPGLLVLITARPLTAFPAVSGEVLRLEPLPGEDIGLLTDQIAPGISAALRDGVVERADGVPLFAKELAYMCISTGAGEVTGVPPRLHDLLVSRLDQRPEERPLLEILAVVGVSALRSLVERLAAAPKDEVRRGLHALVGAGMLHEDGPEHNPVYRFSHVLLRDAAYGTILRSRRRTLHKAVATALEDEAAYSGAPLNLLAHHLEQAGEVVASLRWWWRAAREAAMVAAHREVVVYLRHVLDLLSKTGPVEDVDEIEVLVMLGVSLGVLEGYTSEEVAQVHQRARALLRYVGSASLRSGLLYPVWAYHHVRGELGISSALSQQLWEHFATRTGSECTVAATMAGFDSFQQGQLEDAITLLRKAQSEAREPIPEMPHEAWSAVTVLLGIAHWTHGERAIGRAMVAAAVERAEGLRFPKGQFTRAFVHCYAAWAALIDDNAEAAAAHADRSMSEATAGGYQTWIAAAGMHAAGAQARLGYPAGAVRTLQHLLAAWRAAGAEAFRPVFLRWLAEAYAMCGDTFSALAALQEGIDHVSRFGEKAHEPELHRFRGLLYRGLGKRRPAVAALRRAVEVSRSQNAVSLLLRATSDLVETVKGSARSERQELAAVLRRFSGDLNDADLVHARNLIALI